MSSQLSGLRGSYPKRTMTDDATFNSTALSATIHVMDQELISWALYGARTPDSLKSMQTSGVSANYAERILRDCMWCFVEFLVSFHPALEPNLEDERSFPQSLASREDLRADNLIGALRKKICENACNEDLLCYVHVNEGCRSCDSMPRSSGDEWQRHIT